MEPSVTKHMLFNHFSGQSTPMQKRLIEEWLRNETNQEHFYQWLVEWEQQYPQYLPELDEPVEKYVEYMQRGQSGTSTPATEPEVPELRRSWLPWLVAASIVVFVGIFGWHNQAKLLYQTYETAYGETRSFQLTDGSRVTLNANSSLRVPRFGFGKSTREVVLDGEAEFSVTHTADNQKFIVKTNKQFDVVVLGTEFTVFARPRGAKVVLNKGKVQLRYQEGPTSKEVMMKPGDLVTIDERHQLKQEVTEQPQKHSAWKEHRFEFDDTSLQEFTQVLYENYGLRVRIEDETLARRTLVGSFRADNAQELLTIVSELFNLKVVPDGAPGGDSLLLKTHSSL
ncbi:ferric-dicitrate binding protein FerR (iron transport regulator) [Rhabdobacter roseus]|uniref:Ferric-dicitrate binding protein FerR (Iron transport regulator) n=1 Tax=Rhabdobacter roseus TaxID=1655419 RepID=A0A840TXR3_9BACT|nr:FecR domain-containing protein [Rhabdobacter roseus]MBB5286392.1 ferric-dicitrate binding protein FerR (iron transport regulator) [Rhabdobacter roseus]